MASERRRAREENMLSNHGGRSDGIEQELGNNQYAARKEAQ